MNKRIIIVQRSANLDGSAFSGLLLADGFLEDGWETHVVFGFKGDIIQRYAEAGHKTHIVNHNNWLRRTNLLRFIKDVWVEWQASKNFASLINEIQPDIVYINSIVSLAGAVAAKNANLPCVWHLRELFINVGGEMRAPQSAMFLVRSILTRYASKLVANSEATALNVLNKHKAHLAKIIPNAIDDSFFNNTASVFEARLALKFPTNSFILGVPSTIRPMKGQLFLLRAFLPLLKEQENIIIAFTGGTSISYIQELKTLIQETGIEQNIHFTGVLNNMLLFYRACDIICIPSRAEAFGRIAIEAFASGTPVVASAVGGLQEIITDNVTGCLIPHEDASEFCQTTKMLLADDEKKAKLRKNALKVAKEKFHASIYKNRLINISKSLL